MADTESDLLRSSLDLLILKALSWSPMHGYGITEWIEQATRRTLFIEEGTLYPALHRIERRGWISAEWGVSENNRRAKYYTITKSGRKQLASEADSWVRMAGVIGRLLKLSPER
jgi:PadR family transcriptional regulator, regulatory protein PadR